MISIRTNEATPTEDNVWSELRRRDAHAELLVVAAGAPVVVPVDDVARVVAGVVCVAAGDESPVVEDTSTVVNEPDESVDTPPVIVDPVMGIGSVMSVDTDEVALDECEFTKT